MYVLKIRVAKALEFILCIPFAFRLTSGGCFFLFCLNVWYCLSSCVLSVLFNTLKYDNSSERTSTFSSLVQKPQRLKENFVLFFSSPPPLVLFRTFQIGSFRMFWWTSYPAFFRNQNRTKQKSGFSSPIIKLGSSLSTAPC